MNKAYQQDTYNPFLSMSRHELGTQAVIILEKLRKIPDDRVLDRNASILHQQADRLVDAFKIRIRANKEGA